MAKTRICSIPDCGKPHRARTLCKMHYDLAYVPRTRTNRPRRASVCSVQGCTGKYRSNGFCLDHYNQDRNQSRRVARGSDGSEVAWPRDAVLAAVKSQTDECILWQHRLDKWGYPRFRKDRRNVRAHREVCRIAHGAPPTSAHVTRHACNTPRCINPRHLKWGTRQENSDDMVRAGRSMAGRSVRHLAQTEREVIANSPLVARLLAEQFKVSLTTIYLTKRKLRRRTC